MATMMEQLTKMLTDGYFSKSTETKEDHWDQHGCFVYMVINVSQPRFCPSVDNKHRIRLSNKKAGIHMKDEHDLETFAREGDLVCVDLIRHSRDNKENGPFLRLSNHTGWLFEKKDGIKIMERLTNVKEGLWAFYADNFPIGIALRNQPTTSPRNIIEPKIRFLPQEKVYCDRKVVGPDNVTYYRVQGSNSGWVFDKRYSKKDRAWSTMLVPESRCKSGMFAYLVTHPSGISVRNGINDVDSDDSKTTITVRTGDCFTADVVRCEESLLEDTVVINVKNGPFLRMSDGSGWLFEKANHAPIVVEVPIQSGLKRFRIMSAESIKMRCQPIDRDEFVVSNDGIKQNEEVECDMLITNPYTTFQYLRVKGTYTGWIRYDHAAMKDITEKPVKDENKIVDNSLKSKPKWTTEFIRSVALALDGELLEVSHDVMSEVLIFQQDIKKGDIKINIYYGTRTVGTIVGEQNEGVDLSTELFWKDCSDAELIEVMSNPSVLVRYPRTKTPLESMEDEETELRKSLLDIDTQIKQLEKKRQVFLKTILPHASKRHSLAKKCDARRDYYVFQDMKIKRRQETEQQQEASESYFQSTVGSITSYFY